MDRASGKCGRSSHVKELVVLNEELDCRREVGLVLGPRVGVAGDGVDSLLAGDRTLCRLSLTARLMSPKVAREIPGITEPRRD